MFEILHSLAFERKTRIWRWILSWWARFIFVQPRRKNFRYYHWTINDKFEDYLLSDTVRRHVSHSSLSTWARIMRKRLGARESALLYRPIIVYFCPLVDEYTAVLYPITAWTPSYQWISKIKFKILSRVSKCYVSIFISQLHLVLKDLSAIHIRNLIIKFRLLIINRKSIFGDFDDSCESNHYLIDGWPGICFNASIAATPRHDIVRFTTIGAH